MIILPASIPKTCVFELCNFGEGFGGSCEVESFFLSVLVNHQLNGNSRHFVMVYKSPATKKLFDLCIGDGSHGQSAIKTCPAAIFVRRQVQDQIVRTESAFSN